MSARTTIVGLAVPAVLAIAVLAIAVARAAAAPHDPPAREFAVEIAEDATRFAFDDAPVFDDGLPAYGNQFVTAGYIYEVGTLADGGGVNADGTPTHPEAVIGTWICEGVFVGDGAHTQEGPWVVTTQIFDFGEFDGFDVVVTHGIETPVVGEAVPRAVIGGDHRASFRTQLQVLEGFNDSTGVNLTVELQPGGRGV